MSSSPSSPNKIVIGIVAGLLAVALLTWIFSGRSAPEPAGDGPATRREIPRQTTLPSAGLPSGGAGSSGSTSTARASTSGTGEVEPADPAAEFRIERFTGRVLNGITYQPLPGAVVQAFLFEEGNYNIAPGYPPQVEEARSDSGGVFRFQERTVGRGEVLAWKASLDGYTSMMLLFPAGEGIGDRLRSTFLLRPAGSISGVVLNEDDEPVVGALVGDMIVGQFQRPGTPGENFVPSATAITDAAGRFRLVGLQEGRQFRLPVKAEGFVDFMSESLAVGREDVVFRLVRADARMRGLVVDWEGQPARGVKISLSATSSRAAAASPQSRNTTTGSDGVFRYLGLASGEYQLIAELDVPDSLGPGCIVTVDVAILSGEEKRVEIKLPAPARIEGRFVDASSGRGVAGVRLFRLIDDVVARERAFSTESEAHGGFAFTAFVPPDERGYEVRIPVEWGEEWFPLPIERQPDLIRVDQQWLSFMAVNPGEKRTGVEIMLGPGGELTGVVIQPDGTTPAADNPVFVRSERFFTTGNTDDEGRFRFIVPTGVALRLESATEEGIGALRLTTREQMPPQRLLLEPYATLSGEIRERQGPPLGEVVIGVRRSGGDSFRDAIRFEEKGMSRGDGSWRIDNVAPGRISLLPELSNSSGFMPPKPLHVEVAPSQHLEGIMIELEEGDYVEGVVLDDITGQPISGVTLLTSMQQISSSTGDDGRFRLTGIPYDSALEYVTASIEGYGEETRRNVSIYDKEVVFRLRPRVALEVRAVDPSGMPVPSYRLRVLSFRSDMPGPSGQVVRETMVNHPEGVYIPANLGTGNYRIEIMELRTDGAQGRSGAEDFVVRSTGDARQVVTVRLDAAFELRGFVLVAGNDTPVAGAEIELLNPPINLMRGPQGPGGRGFLTASNGAGAFAIGPIAPGTYRLRAMHEGAASPIVTVQLREGSEPVTLELVAKPSLHGSLTAPDGNPVRRATIFLIDANGAPTGPPLSAREGRYDIHLPTAGTWQVVFSQDDTQNVITRMVTLAPGERQVLDIDFSNRVTLVGRFLINGQPAFEQASAILRSNKGEEAVAFPEGPGANYRVELTPDVYQVLFSSGPVTAPTNQTVTVDASPERQTRDLSINVGGLDLVVVANDERTINGELLLEARLNNGGAMTVMRGYRVDRVSMRFLNLPAGAYRGILTRDGEITSSSDWVEVRGGGAGTMTLDWR